MMLLISSNNNNRTRINLLKIKPNYYIPENQELYEYLDNEYDKITSKNSDFGIINPSYDLDKAIEQYTNYEKYNLIKLY